MKRNLILLLCFLLPLLAACGPSPEAQATMTATAETATAAQWTSTSTATSTFTSTFTFTPTFTTTSTPTETLTPTITFTPSITFTPTYDFPKFVVLENAFCRYGPDRAYLEHFDAFKGDKGFIGGRALNSAWVYVKLDRWHDYCWVHPASLEITGDYSKLLVQQVRLPMTNELYAAPTNVLAVRDGDEVTVTWDEVWMTLDDDRGYFLDVFVCQGGNLVWMPTHMADQYQTSITFVDEPGCAYPSGGKLYTVEKHGYPDPVVIPWPK